MPNRRSERRRDRKARKAHQLRVLHLKMAAIFASSIDLFSVFLRPVELAAVMSVCRETAGRHWENLLDRYMRFFYKQDLARLFGVDWLRDWHAPVREKLQTLLNRQCRCGVRTDYFNPDSRRRMCIGCAYYFTKHDVKSLTTALFYDDAVYLEVNAWSPYAFTDISNVPLGKRVKIVGRLSTAYDLLRLTEPIWIDGIDFKRSVIPAMQVIISAAVRMTDVSVVGSVPIVGLMAPASGAVVWISHTFAQDTVYLADCLVKAVKGRDTVGWEEGRHMQLHRNVYEQIELHALH